ncbi:hypothetical protein GLU60_02805 [Nanohaloarchaea archaeon H01]|nr:hypothetical protein [Nanohaloarchaea archaeon H01]
MLPISKTESGSNTDLESSETGNFYVFEALDGVGKTSTAEEFAERIGAEYWNTHDEAFEEFKPRVKNEDASVGTNMLFYLGSNSLQSDKIKEKLEEGTDIVMDRYCYSTLAFHYAKSDEEPERHLDIIEHFDFVEPDKAFYLWVNEEERLRRLDDRDVEGHKFETDTEFMSKVDEAYRDIVDKRDMAVLEAVGGVDDVVDQVYEITALQRTLEGESYGQN